MSTAESCTFRLDRDEPAPQLAAHVKATTTQFAFTGAGEEAVVKQLYMIQETGADEAEFLMVERWPTGETWATVTRGLYGSRARSHLAGAWLIPMRLEES